MKCFPSLLAALSILSSDGTGTASDFAAEIFPAKYQNNRYTVLRDFPCLMTVHFQNIPSPAEKCGIILDLPDEYEVAGMFPYFPTRYLDGDAKYEAEKLVTEKIRRNGRNYTRNHLFLNSAFSHPDYSRNYSRLYLRCRKGANPPGNLKAYWRLFADKKLTQEQTIILNLAAPPRGTSPKPSHFEVAICYLRTLNISDEAIRDAHVHFWRNLTEKAPIAFLGSWPTAPRTTIQILNEKFRPVRMIAANHGGTPLMNLALALKNAEMTVPPMMDRNGKVMQGGTFKKMTCPGYLSESREFWEKVYLPDFMKNAAEFKTDRPEALYRFGVMFDIEPGAMDWCFCERCRNDFRKFAGLPALPSAEKILANHADAWLRFRTHQSAELAKRWIEVTKKHLKVPAIICTDPLHVGGLQRWCGFDAALVDADADLFMNMPYYSGLPFFRDVRLNAERLKTPNFHLINPAENDRMFFNRYTPEGVLQNILVCAAFAQRGIGFWPDEVLDGSYLAAVQKGFAAVGRAEKYYFGGRIRPDAAKVEVKKFFTRTISDGRLAREVGLPEYGDDIQYLIHEKDGAVLVTFFNFNKKYDAFAWIEAAGLQSGTPVRELLENVNITGISPDGVLVKIPHSGLALVEIGGKENSAPSGTVAQRDIAKEWNQRCSAFSASYRMEELRDGKKGIAWGLLRDQNAPQLKIAVPDYRIYLDPGAGASVKSWFNIPGRRDMLYYDRMRGSLADQILSNDAGGTGNYRFNVEKVAWNSSGEPEVSLAYTVPPELNAGADLDLGPLEGLHVSKKLTLSGDGGTLLVHWRFTNRSSMKKPVTFGFRIKNDPKTGCALLYEPSRKITRISYGTNHGPQTVSVGNMPKEHYLTAHGFERPGFFRVKPVPGVFWNGGEVTVRASKGKFSESLTLIPDPAWTAGVYFWNDHSHNTVEFISAEKTLRFGESIDYRMKMILK